jgi:hypothetical protein
MAIRRPCTVLALVAHAWMLVATSVAVAAEPAAQADSSQFGNTRNEQTEAAPAVAEFLDEAGRLSLPAGYSGSLDPAGLQMQLDADGAPRFVAAAAPAKDNENSLGGSDPNQRWSAGFGLGTGCDSFVRAIVTTANGDLYVGGNFSSCGGVPANNIARYQPLTNTWSALGSGAGNGVNGQVQALAISGNDLYVGGQFSESNVGAGVATSNLARWNGSSWSALGSGAGNGLNNSVTSLAVSGTDLFAAGSFTAANAGAPITANRVARWNGSAWSVLGSGAGNGVNSTVTALAVSGSDLYVGGVFTEANSGAGISVNRLARWNGSVWSSVGSGAGNGVNNQINALAVAGGDLYVGGSFTQANVGEPINLNRLARWNGTAWSAVGSGGGNGVDGTVQALAVSGTDLYVGGFFTTANTGSPITANQVARWNGSAWSALGSGGGNGVGMGVSPSVSALSIAGGELFVGGGFNEANLGAPVGTNYIARWNTSTWSALGNGSGNGINGQVLAMAVSGGDLYVGGGFTMVGNLRANYIARWNGSSWSALGSGAGNGLNNTVNALALLGGDLYVGGQFNQANAGASIAASGLARWNGSTWSAVGSGAGNGVSGTVRALLVSGSDLYVGGFFTQVNQGASIPANYIARWNGASWSALASGTGNGVDSSVNALLISGGDLYVGGFFTQANVGAPISANRIARWNGSAWSALGSGAGNGLNTTVNALAIYNGDLYVGGGFTEANTGAPITANRLARWNGTSWSAVGSTGNGLNGTVQALLVAGGDLYVGGGFSQANVGATPLTAQAVARWNGSRWTTLGSGHDPTVSVFAQTDADTLYTGGSYKTAGNQISSRFARYRMRGSLDVTVSGNGEVQSSVGGISCPGVCSAALSWDQPVTLTATPAPGSAFAGWSGGGCSGTAPCLLSFDQDSSVTANFVLTYSVGGTVAGLTGSGLVLRNNGTDDLPIGADGEFTFATAVPDLGAYSVSVAAQPSSPGQTCSVSAGSGNVAGANVTNVAVNCVLNSYTVTPSASTGGSITPSTPQLVLHGQTTAFALSASSGFYLSSVGGSCGGALAGNTFTTAAIIAPCTVQALFASQITSTTTLSASANPVRTGTPVSFEAVVSASSVAPDGQIVITASSGESCTDTGSDITGGSARFSCELSFSTLGPRTLIASFSGSVTHQNSSSAALNFAVMRFADLSVNISDGQGLVTPGQSLSYLIEVRNSGPDAAPGSQLVLASTPALLNSDWTCTAVGVATCPAASGSGELGGVVNLPAGSGLDFIQNGQVNGQLQQSQIVTVELSASAAAPDFAFDPQTANNQASDENLSELLFADGFE